MMRSISSKPETRDSKLVTALITGGAGFIGSHIADECVSRGWQVIILDNLSTGRLSNIQHLITPCHSGLDPESSPVGKRSSLSLSKREIERDFPVHNQPQVKFIEGSITDLALLQKLFSGVTYIFHQAAIASVPASIADPIKTHETNLTGTLNVLIAARDNKVKKVIFASSAAVYGDNPASPKTEDMLPSPQSPYAVHKLASEYYCQTFSAVYGLHTACLRYFNVYGLRQDPNSQYAAVIPRFIQRICRGQPPIVFGDGEQTRDFVSVKDVVQANLLAAESHASGVFNVGNGTRVSINDLIRIVLRVLQRTDIKPVYEACHPGDIMHSLANISKIESLGYIPKYSIEAGLEELIRSLNPEVLSLS